MPVEKDPEIMVEPGPPREGYGDGNLNCGYRSDTILKGSFPNSPIMWSVDPNVILTDEELTEGYRDLLNGSIENGFQFPTTVYMNYHRNGPPSMRDVTTGIDGTGNPTMAEDIAGQPWPIPNPESSAGPPNSSGGHNIGADHSNQNEYDGPTIKQQGIAYGSGPASPLHPQTTSKEIAKQDFTNLALGKSSPTRVGAYSETSE